MRHVRDKYDKFLHCKYFNVPFYVEADKQSFLCFGLLSVCCKELTISNKMSVECQLPN